jgi:hypothetical protein
MISHTTFRQIGANYETRINNGNVSNIDGHLVLSSSNGSNVVVSGNLSFAGTANIILSASAGRLTNSSSFDFAGNDRAYHLRAVNSHLIFSSSAGSRVYFSGSVTVQQTLTASNALFVSTSEDAAVFRGITGRNTVVVSSSGNGTAIDAFGGATGIIASGSSQGVLARGTNIALYADGGYNAGAGANTGYAIWATMGFASGSKAVLHMEPQGRPFTGVVGDAYVDTAGIWWSCTSSAGGGQWQRFGQQ